MIFALAEIAISSIWYVSKFTLWGIYKSLYYLYYGSSPVSNEELTRQELNLRISVLEVKLKELEEDEKLKEFEVHEKLKEMKENET